MTRRVPIEDEVADAEIVRAIHESYTRSRGEGAIVQLRRSSWEYATSAPLEFVTAVIADGGERHYVLKHLGPGRASEKARRAKPPFVLDPQREIEVYRRLLAPMHVGPPLIGFGTSPQTGTYWLLLEHVNGRRLQEVGELETWTAVACWLGVLHQNLAKCNHQRLRREAHLLEYNQEWYTIWLERALEFFALADPAGSRRSRFALRWLAERYGRIVERLTSLPSTIIHGEFYPLNVLVTIGPGHSLVCPVDWEMTAIGPGIIDLAALTSGPWNEQDRRAVIAGYVAAGGRGHAALDEVAEFLEYARIHLAIQWLGWFGRRQAPAGQAHDWLADAVDRAEALGL